MRIDEIKNAVLPGCREFGVRRLDAFGSVARDEATPSSDIDLLVEFDDPDRMLSYCSNSQTHWESQWGNFQRPPGYFPRVWQQYDDNR